ncbi:MULTISPECIES: class I SAM-dependent methyltransferase [unclassified Bradyrhizobium]|uniref:class I SAM-dependent methyltransferase n=1 Tax=unclassified Bradyrhizobium TaxID=2631580 RepID=UPI001FFBA668|nr:MULTISPECIES: class I SAM-dependent methyltransferase [unclassified Bradyrhizobium]MCK1432215.1 class I SAM-dependent methyltransferase [Bradyrhizobium sp. 87]MCK1589237.1 class I SAM-dependent methyltransferase [Bradyrhizobium sp. 169]
MFVEKCRACGEGPLARFLDLGEMPPADQFLHKRQLGEHRDSYPLQVAVCQDCGLVQLNYIVPPEILYCDDYPYESSTTSAGRRHWDEFAGTVTRMLGLTASDLVVDIGSNVGVLLQMFKKQGPKVLGVDPAANIAEIANRDGIETLPVFFNAETARQIVASKGKASVVTGTNVFAHVGDLHDLMRAVSTLLADSGTFIIEAPYFLELLHNLEYDTIYHEHVSYLSVKPLVRFFKQFNMEIFDVQLRDIHGGSIRLFVRRIGSSSRPVAAIVDQMIGNEERERIYELDTLHQFSQNVANNRAALRELLTSLKKAGSSIVAVSAPAKGMTLLNYCSLGSDFLDFVTEKSKLKIGRYTPGVRLEVVSDDMLLTRQPDYALLLAWNFAEEIMNNLKEFSNRGGKFIIPIPTPRIVG